MHNTTFQDALTVEIRDEAAIVTPVERMDIINAPLMVQQLNTLLDEGITRFIVDLSGVHVVGPDGDYPLLHLLKRTEPLKGQVILVCPPGNPVRVYYEMMRLDSLFTIVDSLSAALEILQRSKDG